MNSVQRLGAPISGAALLLLTGHAAVSDPAPLEIARQGVFFVGGQYHSQGSGTVMDGQMFIQFQIPAKRRHPYPIILIHGNGQSGVNFLSTPDGREGWADLFLRKGYAVYVVDQVFRGRSAYHADVDGPEKPFTAETVEHLFTDPQAKPSWPSAVLHDAWPGTGRPGDPAFDQFYASELDSTSDLDVRLDEANRDAGVALLRKIGPSIVLTHSRGGPIGWLLADARPDLVKAVVAVEPWGPPFRNDKAPVKTPAQRPWGLTIAPLTFDPPAANADELKPTLDVSSQPPGEQACWVLGTPRTLPHIQRTPVLLVTGEASYHASYDRCTVRFLTQAGVPTTWLRLAQVGVHGNGHMMMLETNNAAVADAINSALQRMIAPGPTASPPPKRWRTIPDKYRTD